MTRSHTLDAANRHFKAAGSASAPPSTFEAVNAAARATRAKSQLLRKERMEREDAAAAICLPDIAARSGK